VKRRVGEFVEVDGRLAVVVTLARAQNFIPPDHVGVWFGPEEHEPKPVDKNGRELPRVHFLPEECCKDAARLEHNNEKGA